VKEHLIRAEGGIEGLIWLVLFVFWVVAQVFSRKAKQSRGKPGRPPPSPGKSQTTEQSLQDFLERLNESMGGQPVPKEPPPPTPTERELHPTIQKYEERQRQKKQPPAPQPRHATPPPPPGTAAHRETHPEIKAQRQRRKSVIEERAARMQEIMSKAARESSTSAYKTDLTDEGDRRFTSPVNTRSQIVSLRGLRMSLPRIKMPSMHRAPPSSIKLEIKSGADVKRAIVARIVLGPPRALAPETYDRMTGVM